MPQISKELLSDAMYCTWRYQRVLETIRDEAERGSVGIITNNFKDKEEFEAELKMVDDRLNQLRALYEAPGVPAPRPPTIPED